MSRPLRSNPKTMHNAGELRNAMTPAERKLWGYLRNGQHGVKFRRQHAIGPYIADFCCVQKKLIIELDGSQHLEQEEYDRQRSEYLQARGYRVLRFWNNAVVDDINGVMTVILDALGKD